MTHDSGHMPVTVKRVFDWPMMVQTIAFLLTLVGIAIVSEHRITAVEQALSAQTEILAKIQMQQLKTSDIMLDLVRTQERLMAVSEYLSRRVK